MKTTTIALTPRVQGVGGMVSFRRKFTTGLEKRGISVTQDLTAPNLTAVLVIGGTRNLAPLRKLKRRGVPIVQRLDGMNWLHRKLPTGRRHWLRAEIGNHLLNWIRRRYADRIIYQSAFSKAWWERSRGPAGKPDRTVHNGVDLARYSPEGSSSRPADHYRILLVEGSLQGGYEIGLENAVQLVEKLAAKGVDVRLAVAGQASEQIQKQYAQRASIDWLGLVAPEDIPKTDRSAHALFSADLNAACPNAVIEALACGLPVLSFDTGALAELVGEQAGAITPYGGDPWLLDPPDFAPLTNGAEAVLNNQAPYRQAARQRAEKLFGLEKMIDDYLDFLT